MNDEQQSMIELIAHIPWSSQPIGCFYRFRKPDSTVKVNDSNHGQSTSLQFHHTQHISLNLPNNYSLCATLCQSLAFIQLKTDAIVIDLDDDDDNDNDDEFESTSTLEYHHSTDTTSMDVDTNMSVNHENTHHLDASFVHLAQYMQYYVHIETFPYTSFQRLLSLFNQEYHHHHHQHVPLPSLFYHLMGLEVQWDPPSDGSCFYHCIEHTLVNPRWKSTSAQTNQFPTCRTTLHRYLRLEMFKHAHDTTYMDQLRLKLGNLSKTATMGDFLNRLHQLEHDCSDWAGRAHLQAAADYYHAVIVVFNINTNNSSYPPLFSYTHACSPSSHASPSSQSSQSSHSSYHPSLNDNYTLNDPHTKKLNDNHPASSSLYNDQDHENVMIHRMLDFLSSSISTHTIYHPHHVDSKSALNRIVLLGYVDFSHYVLLKPSDASSSIIDPDHLLHRQPLWVIAIQFCLDIETIQRLTKERMMVAKRMWDLTFEADHTSSHEHHVKNDHLHITNTTNLNIINHELSKPDPTSLHQIRTSFLQRLDTEINQYTHYYKEHMETWLHVLLLQLSVGSPDTLDSSNTSDKNKRHHSNASNRNENRQS